MGYLTLNQTRKLVPLLESDGSVSTTPTVGLWVQFTGGASPRHSTDEVSLVSHPFCWGACLKYLSNDHLQDRRFADTETFLLVRIHIAYL